MRDGYLLIETDPAHPGLIRLRGLDAHPFPSRSDDTRFVGHFNDVDAALMHFHEGLKRHLLDVDARIYRADVREAITVADAIALPHRRLFASPDPDQDPALARAIGERRSRHRQRDRVFDTIGVAGLLLLLMLKLLGL